jgi:hypothetical protein
VVAEDGLKLARDLLARKPLKLDAAHGTHSLPSGHERTQRVASVKLIAAKRDRQQHPGVAERANQQGDEVERRPIRPVQVLDHQHQRLVGGEPLDHAEHQLQYLALPSAPAGAGLTEPLGSSSGSSRANSVLAGPRTSSSSTSLS